MTKTISISGMMCMNCVKAVTEALKNVDGVQAVEVSLEKKNAVVTGAALNDAALKEAVEDTGFDVTAIA
ncbi:MAG: heavy-metal-associated domain-containing protein [Phascolarctobacterium sp.]|nr:heavy-metal-associated domain-containing protein [Phascolarctobacterium sp.]